jgi:hypothetical protein
MAIVAARNCGAFSTTVRKTIDTLVASLCIVEGHWRLPCDRDFDAFERRLGLRVVRG